MLKREREKERKKRISKGIFGAEEEPPKVKYLQGFFLHFTIPLSLFEIACLYSPLPRTVVIYRRINFPHANSSTIISDIIKRMLHYANDTYICITLI